MTLQMAGIDFRTAALDARQQYALTRQQAGQLLAAITLEGVVQEAVALSTCNRTEFYYVPSGDDDPLPCILSHVQRIRQENGDSHLFPTTEGCDSPQPVPAPDNGDSRRSQTVPAGPLPPSAASSPPMVFYRKTGRDVVRHLFRVSASLESQIIGEHEILGQVKDAYTISCQAKASGFLFHKLMHWAFRAAKRVQSETALGQGTASVSQAAVDLAGQIFSKLSGKRALLVGAGQTAELAAQALVRAGVTTLTIANRSADRAEELAAKFLHWHLQEGAAEPAGRVNCPALLRLLRLCSMRIEPAREGGRELSVRTVKLDSLAGVIADNDLVIASTGAGSLLTVGNLKAPLSKLKHSLLMIDLAVPRDIDPGLGNLPNVFCHDIDSLEGLVEANIRRRSLEIPRAEAIVDDEVEAFWQWHSSLEVVPTIKLLAGHIGRLQQAELSQYRGKLGAEDLRQMEEFARALCNKILHDPLTFLRQAGSNGQTDRAAIEMVRRMFKLEEERQERHK